MSTNGAMLLRGGIVFGSIVLLAGCGSGGGVPTAPQSNNQAPAVSASTSRSFGVAQVTTFTFTASTSDPDGDSVSIAWNFGDGTSGAGGTVTKRYTAGGTMRVIATATDSRGRSAVSQPVTVTVGSMAGSWRGTIDLDDACLRGVQKPISASFTQQGGLVRGSVHLAQGLCNFQAGTAQTDPAEPGTINSAGDVRIRIKIPPFIDTYLQGRMDSSGRRITGGLQGSGHRGTPFVLTKQ